MADRLIIVDTAATIDERADGAEQRVGQHEQGGSQCHQRVGADAGASGAQLAFEPYQCAQCRAKHDAYGAVENDGQRKRGEHEIHLLKK